MLTLPPEPPAIIGRASVIDGDTLEIHGQRIRLWGIDAPESRQTCARAGETYRCGQESARQLASLLEDKVVECRPQGRRDRYRRIVARCSARVTTFEVIPEFRVDVGGTMVGQGWALDYPSYSEGEYADDQDAAARLKAGIWAGEFQTPWEWRAR